MAVRSEPLWNNRTVIGAAEHGVTQPDRLATQSNGSRDEVSIESVEGLLSYGAIEMLTPGHPVGPEAEGCLCHC